MSRHSAFSSCACKVCAQLQPLHSTRTGKRLILCICIAQCICKCIFEITGIPRSLAVFLSVVQKSLDKCKKFSKFGGAKRDMASEVWMHSDLRCSSNIKGVFIDCWFLTHCLWRKREQWGWRGWRLTLRSDQGRREDSIFNSLHNFQHTLCFTDVMAKL